MSLLRKKEEEYDRSQHLSFIQNDVTDNILLMWNVDAFIKSFAVVLQYFYPWQLVIAVNVRAHSI